MNSLNDTASYACAIQSMRTSDAASFPLHLNPNGGNVTVRQNTDMGYALGVNGIMYSNTSSRAPIFYDSNDTTYYIDPATFTNVYGGIQNSGAHGNSQIINKLLSGNNGAGTGEVRLQMWCSEPGITWDWAGFGYNVTNDGGANGFGRINTGFGQAYMRMGTGGQWYFYTTNTSGTRYTHIYLSPNNGVETYGILYNDTSMRAPLFYDSNNTAYYTDPASTSALNVLTLAGNLTMNGAGNSTSIIFGDATKQINVEGYWMMFKGHQNEGFRWQTSDGSTYTTRMQLTSSALTTTGSFTASGNVTAYSDERLKKNWVVLPSNFIEHLAKVKSGTYTRIDSDERQVGVSAQGLQEFLEEAVMTNDDGMLSVNYGGAALASAVELAKEVVNLKELSTKQQTQIEDQSSEISELKSMINMLVDKINKLVD